MNRSLFLDAAVVLSRVAAWVVGSGLLAGGVWALFHGDVPHVKRNLLLLNVCLLYLWLSKNWAKPPPA